MAEPKLGLVFYAPAYNPETFRANVLDRIKLLLDEHMVHKIVVIVLKTPNENFHGEFLGEDGPPAHLVSNTSQALVPFLYAEVGHHAGRVTVLNLESPHDAYAITCARECGKDVQPCLVPREWGVPTPQDLTEHAHEWMVHESCAA